MKFAGSIIIALGCLIASTFARPGYGRPDMGGGFDQGFQQQPQFQQQSQMQSQSQFQGGGFNQGGFGGNQGGGSYGYGRRTIVMFFNNVIFRQLKYVYQRLGLKNTWPIGLLVVYTVIGAAIFKNIEEERDAKTRILFRDKVEFAFDRVVNQLLKIKCPNTATPPFNHTSNFKLQEFETRDAIVEFLNYLNLTEIVEERMGPSPVS
uniref:Uncharacterized protein n=1 Tax=Rhabditophanes sp. KR3021 TaxID=114890 RepID=A0AC35TW96_9BILA